MLKAPLHDVLSEEAEKVYRALIHPDTVIGRQLPLPSLDPQLAATDLKVLDRRQEALAKNLGEGHRVIRGVAGSGKTLVLAYRARLLAENFPRQSVLVTCFTKSCSGPQGPASAAKRHRDDVSDSLDEQCSACCWAPVPSSSKMSTVMSRRSSPSTRSTKHPSAVLAVERADRRGPGFPDAALQFVVRLLRDAVRFPARRRRCSAEHLPSQVHLAGRRHQRPGSTRKLDISYRSTKEILDYAWSFVLAGQEFRPEATPDVEDEMAVIEPQTSPRSGPLPLWLRLDTPQAEVTEIARYVRERIAGGLGPGDIAVLYGARYAGGFDWPGNLVRAFGEFGVPCQWVNSNDFQAGH